MSLVVTAVFQPLTGKRDLLLAAMEEVIPRVHEEAGCELYAIHEQEDGTIVMIEKWESPELLDAHGAGAPVASFQARLDGLLSSPVVVTRMHAIPLGDVIKGAL